MSPELMSPDRNLPQPAPPIGTDWDEFKVDRARRGAFAKELVRL